MEKEQDVGYKIAFGKFDHLDFNFHCRIRETKIGEFMLTFDLKSKGQ